jgi:energy-coupling factor transport system substrate-specific component
MGVKLTVLAAALLAATPISHGVAFLQTRQLADGSLAEPGQPGYPQLTAWATLGVSATGTAPKARAQTVKYLVAHEAELTSPTDLALVALAEEALGQNVDRPLARLRALERANGSVGGLVNGTAWSVLAFRGSGSPVHAATIRWLLARQTRAGGWSWSPRGAPDSNDTAAVVQALRSASVRGRPLERGLRFLLRFRNRDGGFELTRGRGSDAQSTAWAVQAFVAAGKPPPRGALAYLKRLQRSDGSFRYSVRYTTTPVWVTAQVLPALARKAFPLSG